MLLLRHAIIASSPPKVLAKSAHRQLRYHLRSKQNLRVIVYTPYVAPPGLTDSPLAACCSLPPLFLLEMKDFLRASQWSLLPPDPDRCRFLLFRPPTAQFEKFLRLTLPDVILFPGFCFPVFFWTESQRARSAGRTYSRAARVTESSSCFLAALETAAAFAAVVFVVAEVEPPLLLLLLVGVAALGTDSHPEGDGFGNDGAAE